MHECCSYNNYFNSQPHKEADEQSEIYLDLIDISTHSLTRRLTRMAMSSCTTYWYFNSQPHKEADDWKDPDLHE